jgi:hypothetical protein
MIEPTSADVLALFTAMLLVYVGGFVIGGFVGWIIWG